TSAGDSDTAAGVPQVLSHDQWGTRGANSGRCTPGTSDERGWPEEGPRRPRQAVPDQAGRHGEVEEEEQYSSRSAV
ncbi:hypothetical protein LTR17_027899, partial [Elasticomyces elasticus]